MKKTIKLLLIFTFCFNSFNSIAGNICAAEFLGLHNITGKSQLKRMRKIERMETIRNKIRRMKDVPEAIAVDNHNFMLFQDVSKQLLKGRISLARDKWQGLFRRVERNYYFVKTKQELVRDTLLLREYNTSRILEELNSRYAGEPFVLDILKILRKKDFNSGDEMISYLNKSINKSAKYLGWKISNYEFINKELDLLLKGKKCKEICKKQIRLLRRELGVTAKAEQETFSMFVGLKKVKVKDIVSLVNTIPSAKETKLLKSIFYEFSKYIQEKITKPKWRGVIADILYTLTLQRGWTAKHIDSIFTEAINVSNHFFPINKVIMRTKTIADQIEKLKNQNSLFVGDILLLTFARRIDDLAHGTWKEILAEARKTDKEFYKRMKAAEVKATKRKSLTEDYDKSPYRLTAYLLAGGGGFAYLYFNFNVSDDGEAQVGISINADGSLEDLGEVDLSEEDQIIEVKSRQELDETLDIVEALQNGLIEVESK
jgi:hypothetical protein